MREKIFKKGIRRLFSLVLAMAMVVSWLPSMPVKVSAAEYNSGTVSMSTLQIGDVISNVSVTYDNYGYVRCDTCRIAYFSADSTAISLTLRQWNAADAHKEHTSNVKYATPLTGAAEAFTNKVKEAPYTVCDANGNTTPHVHTWNYSANGATIKAWCTASDCTSSHTSETSAVSLTLSASDANYSGNAVSAEFVAGQEGVWKTAIGNDKLPKIMYAKKNGSTYEAATETAPTNVGTYKASITAIDDDTKTASVEFTISPKTISDTDVSLSSYSFVYDTTLQTVTVSVSGLTEDTDYEVSGTLQATALSTGNGYAVTVTGKGNYTGTVTKYWTITKTPIPINSAPIASAIVYGQKLSDSTLTGGNPDSTSGTWSWVEPNTQPSVSDSNSTSYQVKFTPNNTNYGPNTTTVKVTVTKSTPSAPNAKAVAPSSPTAKDGKITGVDATMEYAIYDEGTSSYDEYKDVTGTEITNLVAGTKVSVRVKATDNYNDGIVKELTVPAYKAPSSGKPSIIKAEPAKSPVEEREAVEAIKVVLPVSIDATQFAKVNSTVIPATAYNLSNLITTKGIVRGINTAIAASKLTGSKAVIIYTGKPFCFNREIIKAIQNGNKTVVYYFVHEGQLYSVTVPATVDATKVLERSGFAGPLYVGQQLGTTRLIR